MPTFKPASPTPFRPERAGLDQAAVEALRQQLHRVSSALDAANGNVRARLGDAAGSNSWVVADSDNVPALTLDSDGNLTVTTIAAPEAVWQLGEFVPTDEEDTMTYAATITLDVGLASFHKVTTVHATGNATINASAVGRAGQNMWVMIENDATSGKTITFGTSFRPSATVVGTASKTAVLQFVSDGKEWFEASRTLGL